MTTQSFTSSQLSLYYSTACPYCRRVLNALQTMDISITLKDIYELENHKALRAGTGRNTVPCLRIDTDNETQWMHESLDIIEFLEKNFK